MNKKCSNCNEDLFNKYVSACHLCFKRDNELNTRFINEKILNNSEKKERYLSKTLPFPWKGEKKELNDKDDFFYSLIKMDITEQKLDDGTIIIREIKEYHTSFLSKILSNPNPLDENIGMSFEEYIYFDGCNPYGLTIEQDWDYLKGDYAGEGMYFLSTLRIQKLKEDEVAYDDNGHECDVAEEYIYLSYWNVLKGSYLSRASTNEVDIHCYDLEDIYNPQSGEDWDILYGNKILDTPIKINKIFKFDGKCKSGEKFDRNGNLLSSFYNYNGYLIDNWSSYSLPCIYICNRGRIKKYWTSEEEIEEEWDKDYVKAYNYVMNLEERKNQQKRDEIKREEYYQAVEELEEDFNPTQYHKNCPDCFEKIKLPAKICHFCKTTFSDEEIQSHISEKLEELKSNL